MRTDPVRLDIIHPADCRCTFHRSADKTSILTDEEVADIRFGLIGGVVFNAAITALHYAPDIIAFFEVQK